MLSALVIEGNFQDLGDILKIAGLKAKRNSILEKTFTWSGLLLSRILGSTSQSFQMTRSSRPLV